MQKCVWRDIGKDRLFPDFFSSTMEAWVKGNICDTNASDVAN